MAYQSAFSDTFRNTVRCWIEETSEILLMIRYPNAAGNKEFIFFTSFNEFERQVNKLKPRTCLIVFHDKQLPLRGIVNDVFINKALAMVPDGDEYLLIGLTLTVIGAASWYSYNTGESHEDLLEDMHDEYGHIMAFGPYPEWLYDSETVISALIPDPDGSVIPGAY